jgi:hypothetical protein
LLAAVVGGLFALFSGGESASNSQSATGKAPELAIVAISFAPGSHIATVTGTVRHLGADKEVFAVARPVNTQAKSAAQASETTGVLPGAAAHGSWFYGGPAKVTRDGRWVVQIHVTSSASLTFQAVEVPVAYVPCSGISSGVAAACSQGVTVKIPVHRLRRQGPAGFRVKSRPVLAASP